MDAVFDVVFFLIDLWPLWVATATVFGAFHWWMKYRNRRFIENLAWSTLEIYVPKDVQKSPLAMEIALANALSQGGGVGTWIKKYLDGNLVVWFSLELISTEGNVRFVIKTPTRFKMIIENQIYAQYPEAEITEIQDYVLPVMASMQQEPWSVWGSTLVLSKDDPYPIKTYVDYAKEQGGGSEKEEEQKIDPITPTIELLGSLRPGEHMWFQILVRATQKRYKKPDTWFKKGDWKDQGKDLIKKLKKDLAPGDEGIKQLTQYEKDTLTALERNISKQGFDVGIRAVYLTKKDSFDANRIAAMLGAFKQYNSQHLNGFKVSTEEITDFDYPWQDPTGSRVLARKRDLFDAYVRRSYFYEPYKRKPFVLNAEELATIYHFPGAVAKTPTFKRIESKKAEPPVDLPL